MGGVLNAQIDHLIFIRFIEKISDFALGCIDTVKIKICMQLHITNNEIILNLKILYLLICPKESGVLRGKCV